MDDVFESIRDLVSNHEHKIAFELIKHIMHIISNLDLDDSFGTTGTIMDDLVNTICDIMIAQIFFIIKSLIGYVER